MSAVMRLVSDRRIVLLSQILIALVFLAAALAKIGEAADFARQIRHYHLMPFGSENLLAITLPWIELLAALAILLRLDPRVGSVTCAGLMVVFLLAVGIAVVRHLDIECGCFGTADAGHVGVRKLLENTGFLALALVGCLRPRE
jgi:uncharacterized membrane protein YphA (DoxX/SURF4 family)